MAMEIEHKFLVTSNDWRVGATGRLMRQGYLCREAARTVRVRVVGTQAFLTIKGLRHGIVRDEFEYDIPLADAQLLLAMCHPPLVEKTRYEIEFAGHTWEVDEFHGANTGLVIAEIELPTVDTAFELPPWVGDDVSTDPRYFNSRLAEHPFSQWTTSENNPRVIPSD